MPRVRFRWATQAHRPVAPQAGVIGLMQAAPACSEGADRPSNRTDAGRSDERAVRSQDPTKKCLQEAAPGLSKLAELCPQCTAGARRRVLGSAHGRLHSVAPRSLPPRQPQPPVSQVCTKLRERRLQRRCGTVSFRSPVAHIARSLVHVHGRVDSLYPTGRPDAVAATRGTRHFSQSCNKCWLEWNLEDFCTRREVILITTTTTIHTNYIEGRQRPKHPYTNKLTLNISPVN